MSIAKSFASCVIVAFLALLWGCAGDGLTQPAGETAITAPILVEAVPIGMTVTVEGVAPNRSLRIVPTLDDETEKDSIYRFMYDVRYVAPYSGDVHADPEQYLALADDKRSKSIATNGDSIVVTVPIHHKAAGSAAIEVYVSVALWKTGLYKKGASQSVKVTY